MIPTQKSIKHHLSASPTGAWDGLLPGGGAQKKMVIQEHQEKECPWQCWVNIGSMLSMPGLVQPDFMYVYVWARRR